MIKYRTIGILFFILSTHIYAVEKINNIRIWKSPEKIRLVFDVSANPIHSIFELNNPGRLVIDIRNSQYTDTFNRKQLVNPIVSNLRFAPRGQDARFVIDLKLPVKFSSFSLEPNEKYGYRLVVDLYKKTKSQPKTITSLAQKQRDIVVAIDAGHGGEDPGALTSKGLKEKDIVLNIARRLRNEINRQQGYRAFLIRDGDYFVSLKGRSNIARKKRSDLFLSIHADAFNDTRASGASIYALSTRGATSASARFLAQRENRSDLFGGVGTVSLKDKDKDVAQVLLDLSMTATLESSLSSGRYLLQEMGSITKLHKKQVEQAGFAVLKSPDLPSLLIETGFISNPKEALKISSTKYQKKLAKSLTNGITRYYQNYPPAGTYVYRQVNKQKDKLKGGVNTKVKRGDSLSTIAERYRVSVRRLKSYNQLRSNKIRVGQILKIPPK